MSGASLAPGACGPGLRVSLFWQAAPPGSDPSALAPSKRLLIQGRLLGSRCLTIAVVSAPSLVPQPGPQPGLRQGLALEPPLLPALTWCFGAWPGSCRLNCARSAVLVLGTRGSSGQGCRHPLVPSSYSERPLANPFTSLNPSLSSLAHQPWGLFPLILLHSVPPQVFVISGES